MAHGLVLLKFSQGRDFFQARPVLMLEHGDRGDLVDHLANDGRRHLHRKSQRVVLQNNGHVGPDGVSCLAVIGHDLVVSAQGVWRRNHDAARANRHDLMR